MPEACETPPLSETLVCAAEICQWWRNEEEKRRREFTAITTLTPSLPTSHHQDQWTRTAVARQLNKQPMDSSPPPSPSPYSSPTVTHNHDTLNLHDNRLHDDPAVLIAANQLLELSKRQTLNGVIRTRNMNKLKLREIDSKEEVMIYEKKKISTEQDRIMDKREGVGDREGEEEGDGEGEGDKMMNGYSEKMDVEDDEKVKEMEREREGSKERKTMMIKTTNDDVLNDVHTVTPDLSLLDPRLVQLLASQRLQQLFTNNSNSSHGDDKMTGSSPSSQSNHSTFNKTINGMPSNLLSQSTKPVLTEG